MKKFHRYSLVVTGGVVVRAGAEKGSSGLKQYELITVFMGQPPRCHRFIHNQLNESIIHFFTKKSTAQPSIDN